MSQNQNQWSYIQGQDSWYANSVATNYSLDLDPQKLPPTLLTVDKHYRFYRMVVCPANHDVIYQVENNKQGVELLYSMQLFLQSCTSMYEIEYLNAIDWLSTTTLEHISSLARSFANDESTLTDFLELVDEAIDEQDKSLADIFNELKAVEEELETV